MLRLSYFLISLLLAGNLFAQSPHGKNFNIDCSNCHSPNTWKEIPKVIKFNHDDTSFKLTGQHKNVSCINCHQSLVFSEAKDDCGSCHKSVHQNSVSPECASCHTTRTWLIPNINEIHERSRFPLVGAHATADCAQCHAKFSTLNFEVQGVECVDCHRPDFMAAKNPDHIKSGFSTDCQQCHSINQMNWGLADFAHSFFPLIGGHKINDCFSCHTQGTFAGLTKDCYSCHKKDYDATTNPNHAQANFSTDCSTCHTIMGWSPANFDHNATAFPLTGAHTSVTCSACHTNGFSTTPTDCYSCHKKDYDGTTDPNHATQGFPTDCKQCHTTTSWQGANFDHSTTGFPLTGAHTTVSCNTCHTSGYTNTPTDCYSCHKTDYDNTTDPNHSAQGFPTTCNQCHSTTSWQNATFDHSTTAFPLTGAHTTVSCNACHTSGYTNTPTDCYSCHKTDYDNTTDPNHAAQGFPTDCKQCHSTSGWGSANFDHSSTGFPLTGAHTSVSCNACHTSGYTNTPTDCYSCHKTNYDNTNNPNHASVSFPTTCDQCHTTAAWTPSTWDHDSQYFPIYSGRHNGKWNSCSDCHTNPSNYASHTCNAVCHKSDHHQNEDCYSCHPRGNE